MGYQCITGHKVGHCVYEVVIKESTDIAQLTCGGDLFMMDRKDLEKAKEGKSVFGAFFNIETGRVTTNKYARLPSEIRDDCWVDHEWSREYESERDWS
jgi:hypothetical protein